MFTTPQLVQLALLGATLLGAGTAAGVLSGLLGVGGGIVVVPVLYHGFSQLGIDPEVRTHVAVATSLATVAVTALRSARIHHERGAVDTEILSAWLPAVVAGSVLGTALTAALGGRALTGVFGVVALLVALHMAFGRESWRIADAPPRGPARLPLAGAVGFVSVMMGLGGGTVGVPTLTLLGVPMHRAVGTAAGLGSAIAVPGALGLALAGIGVPGRPTGCIGYLNVIGFALITPTTWLAAPLGARFAHAISPLMLRRGFALFLGLVALRMLLDVR
ncbi:MAG TPA: sulfite exporter TauE/SafE family protein [Myxococcota bacterium]|nr:sulfite exporter TauE/SafE family protein [Myxococcota bacterium]